MKIAIDASSILPARTGIGNYTYHLIRELTARAPQHQFKLLLNSYRHSLPLDAEFLLEAPNVRARRWRIPGPILWKSWRRLRLPPLELLTGSFDLYHSTSSVIAPRLGGKCVVTIHDLYFERHPEHCDPLGGIYLANTLRKRLQFADRIIAVSNTTKRDLIELYEVPPEKIDVIYEGVSDRFRPIEDRQLLDTFRNEYCLPEVYMLAVGTLEPRKNLEGLFRAYSHLKSIFSHPPPLVVVGLRGWKTTGIYKTMVELGIEDDVIFTDYVHDEHMPLIYNAARLFVMPTFFEGFGLPVVEAMACGTPVACSDISTLREVAGEAALFFDPNDPESIAGTIRKFLSSKKKREQFAREGLERSTRFSWRLTARKTIRCYERTMAEE
jgi:glycosyltransferase involved in cell wall biosynthesis